MHKINYNLWYWKWPLTLKPKLDHSHNTLKLTDSRKKQSSLFHTHTRYACTHTHICALYMTGICVCASSVHQRKCVFIFVRLMVSLHNICIIFSSSFAFDCVVICDIYFIAISSIYKPCVRLCIKYKVLSSSLSSFLFFEFFFLYNILFLHTIELKRLQMIIVQTFSVSLFNFRNESHLKFHICSQFTQCYYCVLLAGAFYLLLMRSLFL